MKNYFEFFNKNKTPQSMPIPGKDMVANEAGGYSFAITPWERLNRFLVLGSEKGTYYCGEQALTVQNAENVLACIKEDGRRVVRQAVAVSEAGRAPKNDPAIFVLALAAANGNAETKQAAYAAVSKVCRTGTHLFQFCEGVQALRGWSRGLRKGVGAFYTAVPGEKLAYQLVKYRQRNGWTHRDVLRLAHPGTTDPTRNALLAWAAGKLEAEKAGDYVKAFEALQKTQDRDEAVKLVRDHRFPWETVPTPLLKEAVVWEALLEEIPLTAMVRNLARMTSIGLLKSSLDEATMRVVARLSDGKAIRKSRVHPMAFLLALRTYASGHGERGSLKWEPVPRVSEALEEAFYTAFGNVEPTGKRYLLALDVSGSMGGSFIAGSSLSAREASAAMALVTLRQEKACEVIGFTGGIKRLDIHAKKNLGDVVKVVSGLPFDRTDCAQPMLWAFNNKVKVDTFVVYTDSETWAGQIHPIQALADYRKKFNPEAKLVVVGMTSNGFTIADPNDRGMLDVVGFDTATPQVISDFAKDEVLQESSVG
jgi:60 kDa SS-A/Ro ribonucleoprotein